MAAEFGAVGVHAPLTPNDVSVRERERAREGEKRESARAREKRERETERRARARERARRKSARTQAREGIDTRLQRLCVSESKRGHKREREGD